jgi:hypothetical protein
MDWEERENGEGWNLSRQPSNLDCHRRVCLRGDRVPHWDVDDGKKPFARRPRAPLRTHFLRSGDLLRHKKSFSAGRTLQHLYLEGRRDFLDWLLGRLVHLQDLSWLGYPLLRQRAPIGRMASGRLLVDEKIGQARLWQNKNL